MAFVSSCVADARGPSPKSDGVGLGLVLNTPKFSEDGVATVTMVLTNKSGATVCTAPNPNPTAEINIASKRTGLRVFDQPEDYYLDASAVPATTKKNTSNFNHPVVIKPNKSFPATVMMEPLRGAYFADSQNVYVKDFVKDAPLTMQVDIFVFDCKYENLNKALEAEDFIVVRSNSVSLPQEMSGFIE